MCEEKCYLREATFDDTDLLFEWVNDEDARRSAFFSEPISYEEHIKWFEGILRRTDCKQYIYMSDGMPIGEIRITILNMSEAEISYSICATKRHMGQGKELLQLIKEKTKEDFPNVDKLIGKVKPHNIASQKTFIGAGYDEKYREFELYINK